MRCQHHAVFIGVRYEEGCVGLSCGLESLLREWQPILQRVASLWPASTNCIDVMVDQELESRAPAAKNADEKERLRWLEGKTAIANAKLAYVRV